MSLLVLLSCYCYYSCWLFLLNLYDFVLIWSCWVVDRFLLLFMLSEFAVVRFCLLCSLSLFEKGFLNKNSENKGWKIQAKILNLKFYLKAENQIKFWFCVCEIWFQEKKVSKKLCLCFELVKRSSKQKKEQKEKKKQKKGELCVKKLGQGFEPLTSNLHTTQAYTPLPIALGHQFRWYLFLKFFYNCFD